MDMKHAKEIIAFLVYMVLLEKQTNKQRAQARLNS